MPSADLLMLVEDIEGESNDAEHPDAIAIHSWQFEVGRSIATVRGADSHRTGLAQVGPVRVTCAMDKAVASLLAYCTNNERKKVKIIQRRPGGGKTGELAVEITLEESVLTQVSLEAREGMPELSLLWNYVTVTLDYRSQASAAGQAQEVFTWTYRADHG